IHGLPFKEIWDAQMRRLDLKAAIHDIDTSFNTIEVDSERLDLAKKNLSKVDVIGFTERFDEFLEECSQRFDWRMTHQPKWFVGGQMDVPDALRERIAQDNSMDIAFYEYARELHLERHGKSLNTVIERGNRQSPNSRGIEDT